MSLLFTPIHLPCYTYLTTTTIATSATSSSASGGGTMELLLQHLYSETVWRRYCIYVRNTTLYNVPAMLTTNCLFRRYSLTQCCKFTLSYGTVVMSNYASYILKLNIVTVYKVILYIIIILDY